MSDTEEDESNELLRFSDDDVTPTSIPKIPTTDLLKRGELDSYLNDNPQSARRIQEEVRDMELLSGTLLAQDEAPITDTAEEEDQPPHTSPVRALVEETTASYIRDGSLKKGLLLALLVALLAFYFRASPNASAVDNLRPAPPTVETWRRRHVDVPATEVPVAAPPADEASHGELEITDGDEAATPDTRQESQVVDGEEPEHSWEPKGALTEKDVPVTTSAAEAATEPNPEGAKQQPEETLPPASMDTVGKDKLEIKSSIVGHWEAEHTLLHEREMAHREAEADLQQGWEGHKALQAKLVRLQEEEAVEVQAAREAEERHAKAKEKIASLAAARRELELRVEASGQDLEPKKERLAETVGVLSTLAAKLKKKQETVAEFEKRMDELDQGDEKQGLVAV